MTFNSFKKISVICVLLRGKNICGVNATGLIEVVEEELHSHLNTL
jgi:hypothetical protein